MSNLIKGIMAHKADKLIIDANQVDISEQIAADELLRGVANVEEEDNGEPGEFVEGLMAKEIPAEELADLNVAKEQEASAIINEAYDEVAQMKAIAEKEIQELKEQAITEGSEQGYSQGMAKAQKEIEQKEADLETAYQNKMEQCQRELEDAINQLEPQFVNVITELIPTITNVSIQGQKDVILYLINQAMKNIENSHSFLIMVSSADYPYVAKNEAQIYGFLNPSIKIEIMEDAKLGKNECIIDTDNGLIDAGLSTSISQLIKSLQLLSPK